MSPAPRWPVVLFDFDGTLLNTIDGIVASYIYTWQTVSGRQVVRSEILPWIGRTLADVFADEDPANAAELEDASRSWRRSWWMPASAPGWSHPSVAGTC